MPNVWLVWDGLVGAVVGAVVGVLGDAVVGAVVGVLPGTVVGVVGVTAGPLVGVVVGASATWVVGAVVLLLLAGSFLQAVIDTTVNKARTTHKILFISSIHSVLYWVQTKSEKCLLLPIILTLPGAICKYFRTCKCCGAFA